MTEGKRNLKVLSQVIEKKMPPLFAVLSSVLCFEFIFSATLYAMRPLQCKSPFFEFIFSATLYAMRPLQCKSPFFECVAPFLDSNWNFIMST